MDRSGKAIKQINSLKTGVKSRSGSTIVKTVGLTKRYKNFTAVEGLNMNVKEKSIYGFLGPNGAGKSTTLKMLLGLVRPTEGRAEIFGREVTDKNRTEILRDIGSLIESPSYYGHLTAEENLEICRTIVRLDKQKGKRVSAFSLGMKQRLGLASALLSFPELLILDEPTNGLDPAGIHEMRELIRSLPEEYGMTVIISSHLLSEIDQLADNVGIIAGGRLMYEGTLSDLHKMDESKTLEEIFLSLTAGEGSL